MNMAPTTPHALRAGVITAGGQAIDADVIVYCTGYKILDYDRFDIVGRDGAKLGDALQEDPGCFKGISLPGFPNYFFAVGPNGLVLNVSYFRTAERTVKTIVNLLSSMRKQKVSELELKPEEFDRYNQWMDERFERFTWGASNCNSYYTAGTGHPPFLFPGNYKEFRKLHEASGLHEYRLEMS